MASWGRRLSAIVQAVAHATGQAARTPLGAGAAWRRAGRLRRRGSTLRGRRPLGARTQRLAERDQGDRELVRQRRVRPAVGMRERNEPPHGPLQGRPLGRRLPLGVRLGLDQLAPGLRLDLSELGRQRLDSPDHTGTQGLHTRVVRFGKGTAGICAAAGKQGTGLAILAQHQRGPTAAYA
jgi:hypothetical protein